MKTQEPMVDLTANQMILLLQIYRQIMNVEIRHTLVTEPTYHKDMHFLHKEGLISFDGSVKVTSKGIERVLNTLTPEDTPTGTGQTKRQRNAEPPSSRGAPRAGTADH